MTRTTPTYWTGLEGPNALAVVLMNGRVIARPASDQADFGIDFFIEPTERDGSASGLHCGVQVKTGRSFANDDATEFYFRSDKEHLEYWARCNIPIIGVVCSGPEHGNRMVWFDLAAQCSQERIENGPYTLTIPYDESSALTDETMCQRVVPLIRSRCGRPDAGGIAGAPVPEAANEADVPVADRDDDWSRLVSTFTSAASDWEEVADAAQTLSWYLPVVNDELYGMLLERLKQTSDEELANIVRADGTAMVELQEHGERVCEQISDLLSYVPDAASRIEAMLETDAIAPEHVEWAIQTIELLVEEERPNLWESIARPDERE